jgi:hypothetical protein
VSSRLDTKIGVKQMIAPLNSFASIPKSYQISNRKFGKVDGAVIRGVTPAGFVVNYNDGKTNVLQPFTYINTNDPTLASFYLDISPLALMPRDSIEYLQVLGYAKFRYKKLKVHYATRVPTSTVGSILMGFDPDGIRPVTLPNVYSYIYSLSSVTNFPVWTSGQIMDITPFIDSDSWFYVDASDSSSDALERQNFPGQIYGIWDSGYQGGTAYVGYLYFEYELELFGPKGARAVVPPSIEVSLGDGQVSRIIIGADIQDVDTLLTVTQRNYVSEYLGLRAYINSHVDAKGQIDISYLINVDSWLTRNSVTHAYVLGPPPPSHALYSFADLRLKLDVREPPVDDRKGGKEGKTDYEDRIRPPVTSPSFSIPIILGPAVVADVASGRKSPKVR